jgi:hypothetical protein
LQQFADEARLNIHVSHVPPGTSKWNKIEHRLFCHITGVESKVMDEVPGAIELASDREAEPGSVLRMQ